MSIFKSCVIINLIILFSYNLDFSYKYTEISAMTYFIYIFYFILIFPTVYLEKKIKYNLKEIELTKYLMGYILLFAIDFIYERKIPLVELLFKYQVGGRSFAGIPMLHVLLVNFGIYLSVLLGYNVIITNKKKYKVQYMICILPYILLYSRFALMFSLVSIFIIYVKVREVRKIKKIGKLKILIIVILGMYLFGALGNIREGSKWNDSTGIVTVGGGNKKFLDSGIPDEYFWFYIYLTSNQANFEKTIKYIKPENSGKDFFIQTMLPEILKKRITSVERKKFSQISPALNGAPDITFPYVYYGWFGVMIFLIFKAILIYIYIIIIAKGKIAYRIPHMSLLVCFLVLNNFNNYFIYAGVILILGYAVYFSKKTLKTNH